MSSTSNAQQWEYVGDSAISDTMVFGMMDFATGPDSSIYICYIKGDGSYSLEVKKFNGSTWSNLGSLNFTGIIFPRIEVSDNDSVYVSFLESYNNGFYSNVIKFNGANWGYVGAPNFSNGDVFLSTLLINQDTPYISMKDNTMGGKATVMKFNGTNWEYVGLQGFSDGIVEYVDMSMYSDTLYVAFSDQTISGKLSIMKFNGISWEYMGQGITQAGVSNIDLNISNNGVIYVLFSDGSALNGGVSVMSFNGSTWGYVANPGISQQGVAELGHIDFDENDLPYILYQDSYYNNSLTLKKYKEGTWNTNASWETIGQEGFTTDMAFDSDLYIANSGVYYVAFSNGAVNGKASVMKYDVSTGIKEQIKQSDFTVYPNPSKENITINGESFKAISIVDLSGKVIFRKKTSSKTIDISELPKGIFIIELDTESGLKHSRFVKN